MYIVKSEEMSKAEVFLGRLAKDVLPGEDISFQMPFSKQSNKLLLTAYIAILCTITSLGVYYIQFENQMNIVMITTGILLASLFISFAKSLLLFKQFAPDLIDFDINYSKFGLLQSLISHLIALSVFSLVYFTISSLNGFKQNLFSMVIIGSIIIVLYTKYANLSLLSFGYGIGVLPIILNSLKLNKVQSSFIDTDNINSVKSAITRILFALGVIVIKINSLPFFAYLLFPLPFFYFLPKLDLINASSSFMKVRGKINELTPGTIPDDIFAEDESPYPLAIPTKINKVIQNKIVSTKQQKRHILHQNYTPQLSNTTGITHNVANRSEDNGKSLNYRSTKKVLAETDMSPYAARTLNKIIQKVKQEGPLQRRGIQHCSTCGAVLRDGSSKCKYC